MSGALQPTPYADVKAVLAHFLSQIRAVLGDQFRGLYLDGSLALGDFHPQTSDIDVVVTTATTVSGAHFVALRAPHSATIPWLRAVFDEP